MTQADMCWRALSAKAAATYTTPIMITPAELAQVVDL